MTVLFGALIFAVGLPVVHGGVMRSQDVTLSPGWNAVYLAVSPGETDPDVLFADTPIDVVASCFESRSSAQFMTEPTVSMLRETGWGTWYRSNRPDAFLSNLDAVHGQRAYLVHARTNYNWSVTGTVERFGVEWRPNAYNLVGFPLDPAGPPTFRQFFGGSPAHDDTRIYRMVNGSWRQVAQPDASAMRSGEAFWVYCSQSSDYQGPLSVRSEVSHGLIFGNETDSIELRNATDHPLTVTLEHVPGNVTEAVPISMLIRVLGDGRQALKMVPVKFPTSGWTHTLPPLEAGRAIRIPVEVRLEEMTLPVHSSLLKITTDLGTEDWIPMYATREDKREQ